MARFAVPIITSLALVSGAAAAVGVSGASTDAAASVADAPPNAAEGSTSVSSPIALISEDTSSATAIRHYRYGDDTRNALDVYLPGKVASAAYGSALTPTVVLVHGGSWTHGDKSSWAETAKQLVDEGYVAVAVNYRFAQDAPWPAQRTDVRQAIRWVRKHHNGLHVDTDKIVVLGSSAGAEIASAAVTKGNGSNYARGLVSLSAPSDLGLVAANTTHTKGSAGLARIVTRELLRCATSLCPSLFEKRSAASNLDRNDPPSLVFASAHEWVDPLSSVRFRKAARAAGLTSKLILVPGTRHGMYYWDDVWPTVRKWIAKRMAA